MIISDYHVHTEFSGDSSTPTSLMIEQAVKLGLHRLCLTEHHDIGFLDMVTDQIDIDFQLDTDRYISTITKLKEIYYSDIQLLTGVELGMAPELAGSLTTYTKQYDFDYIIGSTHLVDNMDPYYPAYFERYPGKRGMERYFEVTLNNILNFSEYDSLGHLDYAVRYCPDPTSYRPSDYLDYIDAILKHLIHNGKALEVNTSALKKGFANPNPHRDILVRYKELGGEQLTIGSDAHTTDAIGYGFQLIAELLQDIGFRYYTVYEKRTPEFLSIKS